MDLKDRIISPEVEYEKKASIKQSTLESIDLENITPSRPFHSSKTPINRNNSICSSISMSSISTDSTRLAALTSSNISSLSSDDETSDSSSDLGRQHSFSSISFSLSEPYSTTPKSRLTSYSDIHTPKSPISPHFKFQYISGFQKKSISVASQLPVMHSQNLGKKVSHNSIEEGNDKELERNQYNRTKLDLKSKISQIKINLMHF